MTFFEALDPYAAVIGWLVISVVLLAGVALVVSIVAALLVGLIPLKSVPDHAPNGDESVGATVVSLRSRNAPRSRVPSQPRDRGVSPQGTATLYAFGPNLFLTRPDGTVTEVETSQW